MGAWGSGPFENDGAGDLLASIRAGDFSFDALGWAFEDGYLEVDGGQIALALVDLALDVADTTLSGSEASELYELWEETENLDEWLRPATAAVDALRTHASRV